MPPREAGWDIQQHITDHSPPSCSPTFYLPSPPLQKIPSCFLPCSTPPYPRSGISHHKLRVSWCPQGCREASTHPCTSLIPWKLAQKCFMALSYHSIDSDNGVTQDGPTHSQRCVAAAHKVAYETSFGGSQKPCHMHPFLLFKWLFNLPATLLWLLLWKKRSWKCTAREIFKSPMYPQPHPLSPLPTSPFPTELLGRPEPGSNWWWCHHPLLPHLHSWGLGPGPYGLTESWTTLI